ncbi:hypothetical protein ACH5RR_011242 [Cinchona calisaya]|uniref:UDP-glycosyltransferase 83A1-like n=1 Tax=Cinchona calisaya TaxID=153742 RepID=A0ABD3A6T0_9GENT
MQHMGNVPHVLAVPFPAQGHVIPLMEFALCLVNQGIKVTFVNTEFNHERVIKSLSEAEEDVPDMLHLVSIPDGLEPWEDRNDLIKLTHVLLEVVPVKLKSLIEKLNQSENEKLTCVVADYSMGCAVEVAVKMGLNGVAFWPAAAALLAQLFSIPKLMDDGIIDSTGAPLKNEMVKLSPNMLAMDPAHFVWNCIADANANRNAFELTIKNNRIIGMVEFLICNSTDELEIEAFTLYPEILPIGPLLARNRLGNSVGHFWPEDSDCLTWLDKQPPQSVIYVAFGSFTVFDQTQFRELAMGLELTNMPFLWVVRQDLTKETEHAYPEGFEDRIRGRGRLAGWAPQQKVLSHPSVACFLSHCGWNSTIEGVSNGLPFLCWPYFADQFLNQSYICDVWKVGLGFTQKNGIVGRCEIKSKIEQILADEELKTRALALKAKVVNSVKEEGRSGKNFNNFIKWIKDHSCSEKALVD